MSVADTVIDELVAWGALQPDIRAMVLTSTRATAVEVDRFSDYDVIVFTSDIRTRHEDQAWLQVFGDVVIDWWDPLEPDPETGLLTTGNVVYYPAARKIDFTLWPVEMASRIAAELPAELDAGYRVLLDKDGLTSPWATASGRGYAIALPNCDRYHQAVNDFFIGVPYVVTALLRGELLPAKWVLDYDMRYEYLRPMLEWYAVVLHGEEVRIGVNGKGLQPLLPENVWLRLGATYAGLDIGSNRAAMYEMISLFRNVAQEVGVAIECGYPQELHDRVMQYCAALEAGKT